MQALDLVDIELATHTHHTHSTSTSKEATGSKDGLQADLKGSKKSTNPQMLGLSPYAFMLRTLRRYVSY
jgi:hypothetical protein